MPPPLFSLWHSWEADAWMFDKRDVVLMEALFLLMILGILALLCLQCAGMTHTMHDTGKGYDNDAVEEAYQK